MAMALQVLLPSSRYSTSTMVRKIATGSLSPDSTSSVALTRGRSRRPLACSRKNTAAASVEATTAPASSASGQLMPSVSIAAGAVSAAVTTTPTRRQRAGRRQHVAEGLEPGAQAAVEQDQAERHRAHGVGQLDIVEDDAAGAGFAGQHADHQEASSNGAPKRNATRLDMMPNSTSSEPSSSEMLIASSDSSSVPAPSPIGSGTRRQRETLIGSRANSLRRAGSGPSAGCRRSSPWRSRARP